MNLIYIDFEFLVESDNNPVVVFDVNGKVVYLNQNAEILLGYVTAKELFNLTLQNAPKEPGSKTTQIDLHYGSFNFYSITVSYKNEDYIAIRLYYKPKIKHINRRDSKVETDLNKLLNNSIIHFQISNSKTRISLMADLEIPTTKTNQNKLSLLFRKVLDSFKDSTYIDINLSFKIGEFIIIDSKRYSIISVSYKSNMRQTNSDFDIKILTEELSIDGYLDQNSVILEIPLIKD